MQGLNVESIKTFDTLSLRPEARPRAPSAGARLFRDIVKTALDEKNGMNPEGLGSGLQATAVNDEVQRDLQIGALVAMLTEANVTVYCTFIYTNKYICT